MKKHNLGWTLSLVTGAILTLALIASCAAPAAPAAEKTYTIGVNQLIPNPVLDTFRAGFIEGLKDAGFAEGKNLKVDLQIAQGDMSATTSIAKKFVTDKVDLILTITTPSALATVGATNDIPIVIGFLTDPLPEPIQKRVDDKSGNVTGVLATLPYKEQVALIKEIVPTVKNIGMVYNDGENNSRVSVKRTKEEAEAMGLKIVEATATNTNEVQTAARSLVGRVDVIYITGDNTAQAALASIVKVSEDNKLPLFVSNANSVATGAIATFGVHDKELGKQTAAVAARVLKGEKPGAVPVERPKKHELVVNPPAAGKQGVTIPDAVLKRADTVIK